MIRSLVAAVCSAVIISGCACTSGRPVRLYAGARLPPDSLATLHMAPTVYLYRLDGRDVDWTGTRYELLPGRHLLVLSFFDGQIRSYRGDFVQVPLDAAAGRHYLISAGASGRGLPEWLPSVEDITGRQSGPGQQADR